MLLQGYRLINTVGHLYLREGKPKEIKRLISVCILLRRLWIDMDQAFFPSFSVQCLIWFCCRLVLVNWLKIFLSNFKKNESPKSTIIEIGFEWRSKFDIYSQVVLNFDLGKNFSLIQFFVETDYFNLPNWYERIQMASCSVRCFAGVESVNTNLMAFGTNPTWPFRESILTGIF